MRQLLFTPQLANWKKKSVTQKTAINEKEADPEVFDTTGGDHSLESVEAGGCGCPCPLAQPGAIGLEWDSGIQELVIPRDVAVEASKHWSASPLCSSSLLDIVDLGPVVPGS